MDMYRCLFCEDFTTDSLGALSSHLRIHIRGDYCPACRKYFKNVKSHFRLNAKKDELHAVLYALTATYRSNRNTEFVNEIREKALKLIEVEQ